MDPMRLSSDLQGYVREEITSPFAKKASGSYPPAPIKTTLLSFQDYRERQSSSHLETQYSFKTVPNGSNLRGLTVEKGSNGSTFTIRRTPTNSEITHSSDDLLGGESINRYSTWGEEAPLEFNQGQGKIGTTYSSANALQPDRYPFKETDEDPMEGTPSVDEEGGIDDNSGDEEELTDNNSVARQLGFTVEESATIGRMWPKATHPQLNDFLCTVGVELGLQYEEKRKTPREKPSPLVEKVTGMFKKASKEQLKLFVTQIAQRKSQLIEEAKAKKLNE